jgi:hypothetical protein
MPALLRELLGACEIHKLQRRATSSATGQLENRVRTTGDCIQPIVRNRTMLGREFEQLHRLLQSRDLDGLQAAHTNGHATIPDFQRLSITREEVVHIVLVHLQAGALDAREAEGEYLPYRARYQALIAPAGATVEASHIAEHGERFARTGLAKGENRGRQIVVHEAPYDVAVAFENFSL